jgi:hypothetical protein
MNMKNKCLSITLAMVLILISVPAWSYTAEVGFVKWSKHCSAGVCESGFTDDFIGTAGSTLVTPPYQWSDANAVRSGSTEGSLLMTNTSYPGGGGTSVGLKDNSLSLINTRFMVNLRSGIPDPGYTFALEIRPSPDDYMSFGIYQDPVLGRGMYILDETHDINNSTFNPLRITYSISDFNTIALIEYSDASRHPNMIESATPI